MRTDQRCRIARPSIFRLTTLSAAMAAVIVPQACLATPPSGYKEIVVREIEYGLASSNIFVNDVQGEGRGDVGPASFAVDGSGNWYFPDPGQSAIGGEGIIKVFPPNGPARILRCSLAVDSETQLDVTSGGTVVLVGRPRSFPRRYKEVLFAVVPPDGEERLLRFTPVSRAVGDDNDADQAAPPGPAPGTPDTLMVEVLTGGSEPKLVTETSYGLHDIFPLEPEKGRVLGFSALASGHPLRLDPGGAICIRVSGSARDAETDQTTQVRALCRFDLDGKLISVLPPDFPENRQGRLVTVRRVPPYETAAELTKCAMTFYKPTGEVERVVEFAFPSYGSVSGDPISSCPGTAHVFFDGEDRFYAGPVTRHDDFDRDFVHIFSPEGRYLASGSWPRKILDFTAGDQIHVDEKGNIYFVEFGEESVKLMKWAKQQSAP